MSGKLADVVLENAPSGLRSGERLVLVSLALSARDSDQVARFECSAPDLARRTGLSVATVRNALSILIRTGLIVPLLAAAPGRHQEYRVLELEPHHRTVNVSRGGDALPRLRVIRG